MRINELETVAISCSSQITGMPHASGMSDKIGEYAAEIADLKKLLSLNLQKCFYELNKLNRYINSINDSEMRQQIAFNIGEFDEQYPRKKHNKFLKKIMMIVANNLNYEYLSEYLDYLSFKELRCF